MFALIVQLFQKKRKKDANYISDVRSSFKNTRSRDSASPRAAGVEDRHSETAGIQTWFIHDAAAFGQTALRARRLLRFSSSGVDAATATFTASPS